MYRDETDLENRGVTCERDSDKDETWKITVQARKIDENDVELCKLDINSGEIWKVGTLGDYTDWVCELEQCKDKTCTQGNGCVAKDVLTVAVITN